MNCVEEANLIRKKAPHQNIHNNHKISVLSMSYFNIQNIKDIRLDLSTKDIFTKKSYLQCEYNLDSLRGYI